jgi:hypothetical protein
VENCTGDQKVFKEMNPGVREKYLAALRDGTFEQTTTCLRWGNCYCVLGVLCELYRETRPDRHQHGEWTPRHGQYDFAFFDNDGNKLSKNAVDLPYPVRQWAGVNTTEAAQLVAWNDTPLHLTFAEIADAIEMYLRDEIEEIL